MSDKGAAAAQAALVQMIESGSDEPAAGESALEKIKGGAGGDQSEGRKPEKEMQRDPELLLADDADDDDDDDRESGNKRPDATRREAKQKLPKGLHELAEAAGIDAEKLYGLEVPLGGDAAPITLGKLKDAYQQTGALEAERTELDDRRTEFENEMIRSRQELTEIIKLLPQVPPALLQKAQAAHQAQVETMRRDMLTYKPEWADDSKYQAAKADILEAVKDYGYTRGDLDLVIDARLTKLLHDFAGLKKRVAKANAAAKLIREENRKPQPRKTTRQDKKQARESNLNRAKHGTTLDSKVPAVAALLRGD